jgi:hypothetical protein
MHMQTVVVLCMPPLVSGKYCVIGGVRVRSLTSNMVKDGEVQVRIVILEVARDENLICRMKVLVH